MKDILIEITHQNYLRNREVIERRMRGMIANGVHKPFADLRAIMEEG